MGQKNPIEQGRVYFLTLTVIEWVDVFTRPNHKFSIVDSLKYCQQQKGLELYSWVLMSNHLHMIAGTKENAKISLSDILRDFKKFTSKAIIDNIMDQPESRRKWMLDRFEFAGRYDSKITNFKFWQPGNEAKEIRTTDFLNQKLAYIHDNPVRAMIVHNPEDYVFSSASNYARKGGLLDVIML